jgi:hypothetical protein
MSKLMSLIVEFVTVKATCYSECKTEVILLEIIQTVCDMKLVERSGTAISSGKTKLLSMKQSAKSGLV